MTRRRRRGIALLALAAVCGGLAASDVERRARRADERVGPLVPVAVARTVVRPGTRLTPAVAAHAFAVRQAPARFVPPDSLPSPSDAAGGTVAVPLAAGSYLTGSVLARRAGAGDPRASREGERAVELAVVAGPDLLAAGPGARADVLLTTGGDGGHGRSYLALEDVEVTAVRSGGEDGSGRGGASDGAAARANAVATVRVTVRQAVFLTAAQSFARELRLLLRPPGDGQHPGRGIAVTDSSL